MVKNPPANAGVVGFIPGLGNGNPLQYSCLGNPMDRGAWWGYSPWTSKESDRIEHVRKHMCIHTHTHIVCWNQVTLIAYNRRGSGTEGQLVRQLRAKVWTLLGFRGSTETL